MQQRPHLPAFMPLVRSGNCRGLGRSPKSQAKESLANRRVTDGGPDVKNACDDKGKKEAGLSSIPASNRLLRFLCLGHGRRLYALRAAHWTALAMILRIFGSKKTGLVS